MLGTSIVTLVNYLYGLADNANVLKVVIVTIYATWVTCSLYHTESYQDRNVGFREFHIKVMKRHGLKDDDIGIEEDAICEIDSEHLNTAASFVPLVFERLMLDEAQKIKSNKAMRLGAQNFWRCQSRTF